MAPSQKILDAIENFQTDDDIRQQLIDSIIQRLRNRTQTIQESIYDISQIRSYIHWVLILAVLVIFCILRYGFETVDLKRGGVYRDYKDRQLRMTSRAGRAKQKKE